MQSVLLGVRKQFPNLLMTGSRHYTRSRFFSEEKHLAYNIYISVILMSFPMIELGN